MIDTEIWVGIFSLTAILYIFKWIQSRKKTRVYRVSPESLQRSKQVMLLVLPLVEDGRESPLDISRLPYPKESIKSAAKILAYYFWKKEQIEELERIKHCYVSLSRFQHEDQDAETRDRRAATEKKRLTRELNFFLTHSPFKTGKAA